MDMSVTVTVADNDTIWLIDETDDSAVPSDEDDNDKPDKLTENKTVKFPSAWQKLKECEINGQEFGAGYVAKRCKVELISCGIFKENILVT